MDLRFFWIIMMASEVFHLFSQRDDIQKRKKTKHKKEFNPKFDFSEKVCHHIFIEIFVSLICA